MSQSNDFALPDFARTSWAGDKARDLWQPIIQRASRDWHRVEWAAAIDGLRDSALVTVAPREFVELQRELVGTNMICVPLSAEACSEGYSASGGSAGEPNVLRAAVCDRIYADEWVKAWDSGDDDKIGRLLGTPKCCREAFCSTWGAGQVDSTWEMLQRVDATKATHWPIPWQTNQLLRWLGLRFVPYMPCRHDCQETRRLAEMYCEVAQHRNIDLSWTRLLVDMPMRWSALHGIAEIVTPIFRILARTDYCHPARSVLSMGRTWPQFGATSHRFPFNAKVTTDVVAGGGVHERDLDWGLNGFSSREAMHDAHTALLNHLQHLQTDGVSLSPGESVLDLGCGTGALLSRMRELWPGIEITGVDSSRHKIDIARHRERRGDWRCGTIQSVEWDASQYNLIIVSRQRLREDPSLHERLVGADVVAIYDYSDTSPDGVVRVDMIRGGAGCVIP
jgi:hypothetical protein